MTNPKSQKVLIREPAFKAFPFQNHSIVIFGSSVGSSLASKWAFSPSFRPAMLEIGVVNLGAVVELDVDVWLVNVL